MVTEKSCGAVVYTEADGGIMYLIIRSKAGVYGFPKGHMENGETELETALREVKEEVGLDVELLPDFRTSDLFALPKKADVMKQVVYFLGRFENQTPSYQKEELSGLSLCTYDDAMKLFQFEGPKRILSEANEYLRKRRTR